MPFLEPIIIPTVCMVLGATYYLELRVAIAYACEFHSLSSKIK
jgi:hypothetical protein